MADIRFDVHIEICKHQASGHAGMHSLLFGVHTSRQKIEAVETLHIKSARPTTTGEAKEYGRAIGAAKEGH
jgi:uncharacterized DUF497 family protein